MLHHVSILSAARIPGPGRSARACIGYRNTDYLHLPVHHAIPSCANHRAGYDNYVASVQDGLRRRGLEADDELCSAVFAALDGLMLQFLTIGDPAKVKAAVVQVGKFVSSTLKKTQNPKNHNVQSGA